MRATGRHPVQVAILSALPFLWVYGFACLDVSAETLASPLQVDAAPIERFITSDKTPVDQCMFKAPSSGKYLVTVESEEAPLIVWISRAGRPEAYSNQPLSEPQFRYKVTVDVEADQDYVVDTALLTLRDDNSTLPVHYRVAVYSSTAVKFPVLQRQVPIALGEGRTGSRLSDRVTIFSGYPAQRFVVRMRDDRHRWLRVYAIAKAFSPEIAIIDPDTQTVLGTGWHDETRREAEWTSPIGPAGVQVVVIDPDRRAKSSTTARPLDDSFSINVEHLSADPSRPFLNKARDIVGDSFYSFVLGSILSFLVSYVLYRKSVSKRFIVYKAISDHTVVRADETALSRLRIYRDDDVVRGHVGVCTVKLSFRGHRDLTSSDIVTPLTLRLENASSLLRASVEGIGGWGGCGQQSADHPSEFQISIAHLRHGDWLQLDIFYTQEESVELALRLRGRIVDGRIQPERVSIRRVVIFLAFVIYGCAMLIAYIGLRSVGLPRLVFDACLALSQHGWFLPAFALPLVILGEWPPTWSQRISKWLVYYGLRCRRDTVHQVLDFEGLAAPPTSPSPSDPTNPARGNEA